MRLFTSIIVIMLLIGFCSNLAYTQGYKPIDEEGQVESEGKLLIPPKYLKIAAGAIVLFVLYIIFARISNKKRAKSYGQAAVRRSEEKMSKKRRR